MTQSDRYHYTECGLDNIYLLNGFDYVETPRGTGITIKNQEGLHRAIGEMLARDKKALSGQEFRFLRHEVNLTQQDLAAIVGVNVQTVARLEKRKTDAFGPIQRLMGLLYLEYIKGNGEIREPLEALAELDEAEYTSDEEDDLVFEKTEDGDWQPTLKAA